MLEHCVKFEWKEESLLLREIHHYLIEVYYASRMLESSVLYVGILCYVLRQNGFSYFTIIVPISDGILRISDE